MEVETIYQFIQLHVR